MVPVRVLADAELERSYTTLLRNDQPGRAGADLMITLTALELPFWRSAQVVLATAWTDGGHRRTRPHVFIREGGRLELLEVETENLDEHGYRRRVTGLSRCSFAGALTRVQAVGTLGDEKSFADLAKVQRETCRAVLPEFARAVGSELTAATALLATIIDGAVPAVEISAKSLQQLLAGKTVPNTRWIGAPQKSAPWTVERKRQPPRASGMLQGGETARLLMRASLEVEGAALRFELEHLAFEQTFIE